MINELSLIYATAPPFRWPNPIAMRVVSRIGFFFIASWRPSWALLGTSLALSRALSLGALWPESSVKSNKKLIF